jgi:GT2 family glycosyltransferase
MTAPAVSVVIVTHGAWHWTRRALAALAAHTELAHEVIVVDNASADETPARLAELDGPRIVLNDANTGFGPGCNQGAALAQAPLLLFLNSDAMVHPGWLEAMLAALDSAGWVGAVVPRYLHEDGRLQEAGALLAQDGTVLTYGDGDDPDRLRYRFRRVVDYGGAACMLVRRAEFLALGGFDAVYAPAYYEDVDLCLRLAQTGRATLYEPRALVTHIRHASGGLAQATQLSERNRATFVERWFSQLRGRPASLAGAGDDEPRQIAARDATAVERILVVDPGASATGGGGAASATVARLARERPLARVAWLTAALQHAAFDPQPWLDRGVELVDAPLGQWLAGRPLFFDLVVLCGVAAEPLRDLIAVTQPQARFTRLTPGGVPAEVLAAAGLAV